MPTFLSITPGAQPQAGVRCFPHTPPGLLCIACEGQCVHLSVASTRSSFPTSAYLLDLWADLTPLSAQMTSLSPKGRGQMRQTGSLSPFCNIPPFSSGVKYTFIHNYCEQTALLHSWSKESSLFFLSTTSATKLSRQHLWLSDSMP